MVYSTPSKGQDQEVPPGPGTRVQWQPALVLKRSWIKTLLRLMAAFPVSNWIIQPVGLTAG